MANCSGGWSTAGGEQERNEMDNGRLRCDKKEMTKQEKRTAPACHRQAGCYVPRRRNDAKELGDYGGKQLRVKCWTCYSNT